MYTKKNDTETFTTAMTAIDKFAWDQTSQGSDFWGAVWTKLSDLRDVALEREHKAAKPTVRASKLSWIARQLRVLADDLDAV